MNMSERCRALALILLLFVFLAQCKCLIISYSLSLNLDMHIYILHPHEHIIYQVVLTRTLMLELQGAELLLASPELDFVTRSTKIIKWSTAARMEGQNIVMTLFSSVRPIATFMINWLPMQSMMHNLSNPQVHLIVIKPSLLT